MRTQLIVVDSQYIRTSYINNIHKWSDLIINVILIENNVKIELVVVLRRGQILNSTTIQF